MTRATDRPLHVLDKVHCVLLFSPGDSLPCGMDQEQGSVQKPGYSIKILVFLFMIVPKAKGTFRKLICIEPILNIPTQEFFFFFQKCTLLRSVALCRLCLIVFAFTLNQGRAQGIVCFVVVNNVFLYSPGADVCRLFPKFYPWRPDWLSCF